MSAGSLRVGNGVSQYQVGAQCIYRLKECPMTFMRKVLLTLAAGTGAGSWSLDGLGGDCMSRKRVLAYAGPIQLPARREGLHSRR
jgi:hypothetical protein